MVLLRATELADAAGVVLLTVGAVVSTTLSPDEPPPQATSPEAKAQRIKEGVSVLNLFEFI
jgi:hypothetical protein